MLFAPVQGMSGTKEGENTRDRCVCIRMSLLLGKLLNSFGVLNKDLSRYSLVPRPLKEKPYMKCFHSSRTMNSQVVRIVQELMATLGSS